MPEVADQAVAEVHRRAGQAAQRHTERDAGAGFFQSLPRCLEQGRRQRKLALQGLQCQPRITQMTARIDVVARGVAHSHHHGHTRARADRDAFSVG